MPKAALSGPPRPTVDSQADSRGGSDVHEAGRRRRRTSWQAAPPACFIDVAPSSIICPANRRLPGRARPGKHLNKNNFLPSLHPSGFLSDLFSPNLTDSHELILSFLLVPPSQFNPWSCGWPRNGLHFLPSGTWIRNWGGLYQCFCCNSSICHRRHSQMSNSVYNYLRNLNIN